jgi:hypothetical protein
VATEPSGANCSDGGAKITDGSGNTVYACNGDTGPKGDTGAQGPVGPSTAGNAGLDAEYVQDIQIGGGVARVACPADHPYLLGGGGFDASGNALNASGPMLFQSGLWFIPGNQAEGEASIANGWSVSSANTGDELIAYAICAK